MSSKTGEPGWHRLLGWWHRQWRKPTIDQVGAATSNSDERRALRNAERVEVWEDEGGAVSDRAIPAARAVPPPANPPH